MVRVVFAEDNYLVREGTSALLQATDEVELIGTASSFDELMTAVEELKPDVVLTDIRMPPSNTTEGIDAARRIRADHPDIGVVVLSQFAEEAYAYELLKDGAAGLGYLLKERVANLEELVRAINEVAKGGSVLDPKVVEALVSAKDRMAHSPLAQLTDREREVLENMAQGKNNASIAKSLFLTERAVEKHINSLFHKLGLSEETDVHRRVKAVLAFLRESDPSRLTPRGPGSLGRAGVHDHHGARRVPEHEVRDAVAHPPPRSVGPSVAEHDRLDSLLFGDRHQTLGRVARLRPAADGDRREPALEPGEVAARIGRLLGVHRIADR